MDILKANNIAISMSDKASPYDNAKIESFFRTLKVEEVYMFEYEDFEDVAERITYFIEEVYNKKRLHSSLGILNTFRTFYYEEILSFQSKIEELNLEFV